MSDNSTNVYGVTFGRIMFLHKIIKEHTNIAALDRHDDIAFEVTRIKQCDTVQVICLDEYVLSEAVARQVINDFPKAGIVFIGGKWNRPTADATAFCRTENVGICNAGSVNALLSKSRYWQ